MRFKIAIEYIQICDEHDFKRPDKGYVRECLRRSVGCDLSESIDFAEQQDSLKISVNYLDDKFSNE